MLKKRALGLTGLEVTEICFGALPFGPLQKNLSDEECAEILAAALRGGVNFVDTAQMYKTYGAIRMAVKETGIRPVIASKSACADYDGMMRAVDEALTLMDIDCVDIFHLHAARSGAEVFDERKGALEALVRCRSEGKIRAVGISAHSVDAVNAAAQNAFIDVVFPIINISGIGILNGTREDMESAIERVRAAGKGLYIMKALGGGSLVSRFDEAMKFVRKIKGSASVALGMVSEAEVRFNLRYFDSEYDGTLQMPSARDSGKQFIVAEYLCKNCGACGKICPNFAISSKDGRTWINPAKCLTCGYCVSACPFFAIRAV